MADVIVLIDGTIESETELAYAAKAANIAVSRKPECSLTTACAQSSS